jgi:hypothetical protein
MPEGYVFITSGLTANSVGRYLELKPGPDLKLIYILLSTELNDHLCSLVVRVQGSIPSDNTFFFRSSGSGMGSTQRHEYN